MATLDDILTTQKNGVVGINNLSQELKALYNAYLYNSGQYRSATVTTRTQITSGSGRLVAFIILAAGSAAGTIYDTIILNVTGITGDGTKVTIVYSPTYTVTTSDTAYVTGINPTGYNNATGAPVTDIVSTNSFKYANTTSSTYVSGGSIFIPRTAESIVTVSNSAAIGVYTVGAPFSTGLVINPGTGQTISVIYSLD
jgi:hypothetical protein